MKRIGNVADAVEAIGRGGVALVPTETVVGLVCAPDGLPKVFDIKGREEDKPVALLCRDAEEAFALAGDIPDAAPELARRYWPGPLTLVLKSKDGGTVGLRVPEGIVREVLDAYGGPLYATSANLSGEAAPESLDSVDPRISEKADVIVEGDPGGGEASAVVDLSGEQPRLLRPSGQLTAERLREVLGGLER